MFLSVQSIPGLIFARSDVKAKIRPGVEANHSCSSTVVQKMLFYVWVSHIYVYMELLHSASKLHKCLHLCLE